MAFERETVMLRGDTPGSSTEFTWYRIGPAEAPEKVHLQAALHADEQPGTMVLHHLLPMLLRADEQGLLRARFTVMPMVNPLGMANLSLRHHIGRYDLNSGINYNRRWPDLFAAVRTQLAGRLNESEHFNVGLIRKAVARWIDSQQPRTAADQWRLLVLKEAHDAEFVFDLHCDDDSLLHIFTSPELMPELQDLADWMGAVATLTASDSGGGSFDEVLPQLYRKLALANPGKPVPMASATATLEYRGQADSFDHFGADDARRLYGFLCGRGLIAADPGEKPGPALAATPFDATEIVRTDRPGLLAYRVELGEQVKKGQPIADLIAADPGEKPGPAATATPFEATEIVRTDRPGLLAYRVELGEQVRQGQPIADLIALDGPEAFIARTPIPAGTDGFILSRVLGKYVPRGASIAKIVGTVPLPERKGYLLED